MGGGQTLAGDPKILRRGVHGLLLVTGSRHRRELVSEAKIKTKVEGVVLLLDVTDHVFGRCAGHSGECAVGLVRTQPFECAKAKPDVLRTVVVVTVGIERAAGERRMRRIEALALDFSTRVVATNAGLDRHGNRPLER